MKTIPYSKFKHGQRVTCEVKGSLIEDARISIDDGGTVYICQNKNKGVAAFYKFGYMYTWKIADKNQSHVDGNHSVENLKLLDRTLDDLEDGDVVVTSRGEKRKVLGICGTACFLSLCDNFRKAGTFLSIEELKDEYYTLKQEEPEEEKLNLRSPEAEKMREESRATRFDFVPKNGENIFYYDIMRNKVIPFEFCGEFLFEIIIWGLGLVKRTDEECKAHGEKYARYFLTE